MKCKNCGAELNNGKCEYCGSVFMEDTLYIKPNIEIDPKVIIRAMQKSPIYIQEPATIEITVIGDTERHYIRGI